MRTTLCRVALVVAATVACAAPAAGQTPGAEVLFVRPPAEAILQGQTAARPLTRGARLAAGDRVRTGRDGAVELRLGDGSLVRLAELSDLEIERLDVDAAGAPTTSRFNLAAGQVRAWVARQIVARVSTAQGLRGAARPRRGDALRNRFTRAAPGRDPEPCRIIPLRDKRTLLKAFAFQSATVEPGDPDQVALDRMSSKLSGEKVTGGLILGGPPRRTGREDAAAQESPVTTTVGVE